jgi:hypothetical protein
MKRKLNIKPIKILLVIIFINLNVFGQCPPDDHFYAITQEAVDNFIIDYPNCTSLKNLWIGDAGPDYWEVTDLSAFINLVSVTERLLILQITASSLQGLNNLQTVGQDEFDRFDIYFMPNLSSLEGLESLESVAGYSFSINLCPSLTNLNGLENLNTVNVSNSFIIDNNSNLNDVEGLDCYFFTEEFRNNVPNYIIQENLYPSIFENCEIILSNDNFTNNNISFYPNPAKSNININNTENIEQIDIFDLSGRLIKYKVSDFKNIDLSDLSPGTYILKVSLDSNKFLNSKLIIE